MKHRRLYAMALGSMAVAFVVGLWSVTIAQNRGGHGEGRFDDAAATGSKTLNKEDAKKEIPSLAIEPSAITNLGGVEEGYGSLLDGYRGYQAIWQNIVKVSLTGKTLYLGELATVYGNGKVEKYPVPFLLANGIMYAPWGSGGTEYPLIETNWVPQRKMTEVSAWIPVEYMGGRVDQEIIKTSSIILGFDRLVWHMGKDGSISRIEAYVGDKPYVAEGAELERVRDLVLITRIENKDGVDYVTSSQKYRKIAGNVTAYATSDIDTGYQITYPSTVNNKKISIVPNGFNSYSFVDPDAPGQMNLAYFYCRDSAGDQIGPKAGDPFIIAPQSRARLADWGVSQSAYDDSFSFTGPGYYCVLTASDNLRLSMFTITF